MNQAERDKAMDDLGAASVKLKDARASLKSAAHAYAFLTTDSEVFGVWEKAVIGTAREVADHKANVRRLELLFPEMRYAPFRKSGPQNEGTTPCPTE